VVFIDDLDRCDEEAVLQVLQAIKLYLDHEGCVFVLGVNPEAVKHAVEAKYRQVGREGNVSPEVAGEHYLEKIVQLPFYIPPPDDEKIGKFLDKLEVEGKAPAGITDPTAWLGYVRQVAQATQNNPRQIKRYLNTMRLIARIAPQEVTVEGVETSLDRLKLAKVVLLQFAFGDFYRLICRYPVLLYRGQRYARDRQAEGGEPVAAAEDQRRESLLEDLALRTEHLDRFAEIDRNPLLARLLTQEPLWDSEAEAGCYVTYSGAGPSASRPPDSDQLQDDLLHGSVTTIQAAASTVLSQGEEAVRTHVEDLVRRLTDDDSTMRYRAAVALGFLGEGRAVEPLVKALGDEDAAVRRRAADALAKIGTEEAKQALAKYNEQAGESDEDSE